MPMDQGLLETKPLIQKAVQGFLNRRSHVEFLPGSPACLSKEPHNDGYSFAYPFRRQCVGADSLFLRKMMKSANSLK